MAIFITPGGGGGSPGGSDTQVQVNDGGGFAGFIELTWNKITKVLRLAGDLRLDDGGTFTTTIQTVTPTANRVLSNPDATGTYALVAGSSGQLLYNASGANAGASTLTYDGSILTSSGRFINSYNATASSPAKAFTGTWFTGGTATTTKPHVLIEPTGATSTAWSTSGTGLGVNAASGFAGNLLDLQVNGTSLCSVKSDAIIYLPKDSGDSSAVIFGGSSISNASAYTGIYGFRLRSTNSLSWSSSTNLNSLDLSLSRDAANTLAQRNTTNAQTFRVYNTFTSSTNYELGKLEWSSNVFRIGTEKGSGGGTARALEFQTDGTTRWTMSASSGSLQAGTNAGLYLENGGVGRVSYSNISFPAVDGNILLNNWNANGFGRLQFGGTTSSFPSIKRNSAELQARLADDSAYTTIDAQHRLQGTAPASATATGTAGDIRYDADYIYICTATNTWKRAAITTWV